MNSGSNTRKLNVTTASIHKRQQKTWMSDTWHLSWYRWGAESWQLRKDTLLRQPKNTRGRQNKFRKKIKTNNVERRTYFEMLYFFLNLKWAKEDDASLRMVRSHGTIVTSPTIVQRTRRNPPRWNALFFLNLKWVKEDDASLRMIRSHGTTVTSPTIVQRTRRTPRR